MNDSIRQAVNDRFVMDYDNIPGKGPLMLFRKLDDGTMTLATPDHIVDFVRWHTAELSRLAGRSQGWRPIDEAPKDEPVTEEWLHTLGFDEFEGTFSATVMTQDGKMFFDTGVRRDGTVFATVRNHEGPADDREQVVDLKDIPNATRGQLLQLLTALGIKPDAA